MQKRTKGCLWIGLGVAVFLIMVVVAVVGGLGYVVYQQFGLKTAFVAPPDGSRQLDEIRAGFAGQAPRLTIGRKPDGRPDVHIAGTPPASQAPLTSLHVAAFDPSAGKLVRVTVPFWLLRHAPQGKVMVNGADVLHDLSTPSGTLTAHDIEALGPGLLVDDTRPGGRRLIIWTE